MVTTDRTEAEPNHMKRGGRIDQRTIPSELLLQEVFKKLKTIVNILCHYRLC